MCCTHLSIYISIHIFIRNSTVALRLQRDIVEYGWLTRLLPFALQGFQ